MTGVIVPQALSYGADWYTNFPGTAVLHSLRADNAESVSKSWRHMMLLHFLTFPCTCTIPTVKIIVDETTWARHGNAFRITGLLWGARQLSPVDSPRYKGQGFIALLFSLMSDWTNCLTVRSWLNADVLTLIWRHCHDTICAYLYWNPALSGDIGLTIPKLRQSPDRRHRILTPMKAK